MKNATKEFLSLFYYIKDRVLIDFIEEDLNVPLILESDGLYHATSIMEPSPTGFGRGLVYFSVVNGKADWSREQGRGGSVDMIKVYEAGNPTPLPQNMYTVYYPIAAVSLTPSGVGRHIVRADYYWHYVSVLDAWPSHPIPELPVISVEMPVTNKYGFQLGTGVRNVRGCVIHIFASSSLELKELTETLFDGLYQRCIPVYDFGVGGHPLNFDGTFNLRWSTSPVNSGTYNNFVPGYSVMQPQNVKATRAGLPPTSVSDIDRYRSRITFDLESFVC